MPLKLKKGTFDIEGVGMLVRGNALVEGEDFTFRGKGVGIVVEESPFDHILPLFEAGVPHKELIAFVQAVKAEPKAPLENHIQKFESSGLDKWLSRGANVATLIGLITEVFP